MKKLLFVGLLVFVLLTACGGNAASVTATPTIPLPTGTTSTTSRPTLAPATIVPPNITEVPIVNPPNCSDSAAFVADVTVPDGTSFNQGDTIHKVWRVKNTGTCTWSTQYSIVFASGDQMNAPASTPLHNTKPGDTLDISVDLTAPNQAASYRSDFELHNPSGVAMPIDQAKTLWVTVAVGTASASSSGSSNSGSSNSSNSSGSGSGNSSGSGSSGSGSGLLTSTCAFTTDNGLVSDVVTAINAYRSQNGLPPYPVNDQLTQAAQSHSEDMACNHLFLHAGSDGSTPASRVAAAGFAATDVTENVYGSYPPLSGHDVVSWWATDQTDLRHNQNLISTKYQEIGVGYAFFNNYGYYVVDFTVP